MKGLIFMLLCAASLSIGAFAQTGSATSDEAPIDSRYQACLDEPVNQSTVGQLDCARAAADQWSAVVDQSYQLLLSKLTPDGRKSLAAAQKAWAAYRDREASFSARLYYSEMEGTMWHVVNANRYYEMVRTRARELQSYLDDFADR